MFIVSEPVSPNRELFSLFVVRVSFPSPPFIMLFEPLFTVILSFLFPPLTILFEPSMTRLWEVLSEDWIVKLSPVNVSSPVFWL